MNSAQQNHSEPHSRFLEAEKKLFASTDKTPAWVLRVPEQEAPLQGAAGWLDWRLSQKILAGLSQLDEQAQANSKKPASCVYLPISKGHQVFHVLIFRGKRQEQLSKDELELLKKNIASLPLLKFGLDAADFDSETITELQRAFKKEEGKLWIVS